MPQLRAQQVKLLTVSHNSANEAEIGNNKALSFSTGQTGKAHADFDGDTKSDIIVWRPSAGMWFILTSSTDYDFDQHQMYQLGLPGDIPLTGDIDGDSRTDLIIWRPSNGYWFYRLSSNNYAIIAAIQWGLPGDIPVPGDYDGDGRTDMAVYRGSLGTFYVLNSSAGFNRNGALSGNQASTTIVSLGGADSDAIGGGDFNGDGKDDFATVWRPARFWSVKDSLGNLVFNLPWGLPGDKTLACKYDTDSISDRVVVRSNGASLDWYTVTTNTGTVYSQNFGAPGDTPSCDKDFDGDGQGDLVIFRGGSWFIRNSSNGEVSAFSFGLPGDISL